MKGVLHNYLFSLGTHGRLRGLIIQPHKGPLKDTESEPPDPLNEIGPLRKCGGQGIQSPDQSEIKDLHVFYTPVRLTDLPNL